MSTAQNCQTWVYLSDIPVGAKHDITRGVAYIFIDPGRMVDGCWGMIVVQSSTSAIFGVTTMHIGQECQ